MIRLTPGVVVADEGQPSFVEYGVQEVTAYLREISGQAVTVRSTPDPNADVQIVVGEKSVRQFTPRLWDEKVKDLGPGGYVIRVLPNGKKASVLVFGATPHGTKHGLGHLMKLIRADGRSAQIPAETDIAIKPAFAKRGMHFNGWAFNYPYTFRCWREEDWCRYLDMLAYQGVNLFLLWPFIEIMPVPFSPEDRAYLEECRRVVDYAQQKHGMEVWIMQCTNRVARDRCGVADPRHRPYWRPSQADLNPGNPEDFQAIMTSREALYRILNNADGVCNIDSDPGYCPPGSTLDDYVKVLQGCRVLLDRHNLHAKQAKLVSWMWFGWGRAKDQDSAEHQRLTIRLLKQNLPQPWWLLSGQFPYQPMCREEGVIGKTVFLPYGEIEGEPAYPTTGIELDRIRATFANRIVPFSDLAGVMGNAQTPLLQFPHVYLFTSLMLDAGYGRYSEKEVLQDLANHLYPEHSKLLADAYLALNERVPATIKAVADRLEGVIRSDQFGRLGIFGRKLFPDHRVVAQSLLCQLRLQAGRRELSGITLTTSRTECARLLCEGLDAYLTWDLAHGWHTLWDWNPLADFTSPALVENLRTVLAGDANADACFDRVAAALSAKFNAQTVRDCLEPLRKAVLVRTDVTE